MMCPKCRRNQFNSADMYCEGCVALLPVSKFHIDVFHKWQRDEMTRFLCRKCEGQKKTTNCTWCSGCRREWLSSAFDDAELRKTSVDAGEECQSALCFRCKTEATSSEKLDAVHTCHKCQQAKRWREYSPVALYGILGAPS